MVRILVVCMGNICRSPMAQAIGTQLARQQGLEGQVQFDSAGTHAMVGSQQPEPRARLVLERNGYKPSGQRARQLLEQDFERFDLILGMDQQNLGELRRACPAAQAHKVHLFLDFAPGLEGRDVPDPYFGNLEGFERVFDLCEAGVRGLIGSAGLFSR